jgi:hypothetical protein
MKYEVVIWYTDFGVGSSGPSHHKLYDTLEEAKKEAKSMNDNRKPEEMRGCYVPSYWVQDEFGKEIND